MADTMAQITKEVNAALRNANKRVGIDVRNDLMQEAMATVYSYPAKAYPRRMNLAKPSGYKINTSDNGLEIVPLDPPNTWPSVPPATVNKDLPSLIEEGDSSLAGKSRGGQHYDFVPIGPRPWFSNVKDDLDNDRLAVLYANALAGQGIDIG